MRHARKYFRMGVGSLFGIQPDMQIWWTPELPIIHVANPKAGCSSINQSLKSAQARLYEKAGIDFERKSSAHVADDCLHQYGLAPSACRRRYLISSIRNPYTRALSGYLDKVDGQDHRVYGEFQRMERVADFADFLRALKRYRPPRMDGHFRPQHYNLNYPKVAYDAVFYLENTSAISAFVSKLIPHFELRSFSPHARNAVGKLAQYYDDATRQLVREIFARDFERFGYSTHIDDALTAPGIMIAADRIIPHGKPVPAPRKLPRQAEARNTLQPTLHFRRLMERRLI